MKAIVNSTSNSYNSTLILIKYNVKLYKKKKTCTFVL